MNVMQPIEPRPAMAEGLDTQAAAAAFARSGRVRIENVLAPATAQRLHACLARETPWRLVYNEGARNVVLDRQSCEPAALREIMQAALLRARDSYQYLYDSYPMVTAYLNRQDPGLFLHGMLEWLNSPAVLQTIRDITGMQGIRKADAQATLYRPGHFLMRHDDTGEGAEHRMVAYVLNMTRDWRADWGGLLQFLDARGEVAETWLPGFNVLALFRVPVQHCVSYVTPFATQERLAITGWFRGT
jgi:SM-20-related protein